MRRERFLPDIAATVLEVHLLLEVPFDPSLLSLAKRLGMCRGRCPKRALLSSDTTCCFCRYQVEQVLRLSRSTLLD
jgi:hypothetical protein